MEYLPSFTQDDEHAFRNSLYGIMEDKGAIVDFIGESWNYASVLIQIEKELKRLAKDQNPTLERYDYLIRNVREITHIQDHFPLSEFSPYIKLYFETFTQQPSPVTEPSFLNSLQDNLKANTFKKEIENKKKRISDNKTSLLKYINTLFEYRSRLLVIRVDLSYEQDKPKDNHNKFRDGSTGFYTQSTGEQIDLYGGIKNKNNLMVWGEEVQTQRKQLIKQLNKKYKNDLVGYVWKLEYGAEKAFHYHMMFFLDGSKYRQDITIAQSIGELWKNEITQGKGIYWNLNAEKKRFEKNDCIATGMIKHDDKKLRDNLTKMATYLVKADYFIKTILSPKSHTYDRGQTPRKNKTGRPRK
jgi:hypothetical protein